MTKEQVLSKLTAVCARGEHCIEDMRKKMGRWQIDEETQKSVIEFLVNERYIDEERYARFFINDKIKYNRWGRKKVEQALYVKRIPKEISSPILDELEDETYEDILLPLLKTKIKSVKGNSDYEVRMKLIRFAIQRGFSYDQSVHCVDKIM